jgi:hypothetical protein
VSDETKELNLLIADVIDGLAASDRRVEGLAASLLAMRLSLAEMGADFELRYAHHFAGQEVQKLIQMCAGERDLLLALAQRLRSQS